jgi:hypothetical protein
MKYHFTAIVKVTAEHQEGSQISKHLKTDFRLEPSSNLLQSKYLDRGLPTKEGSQILTEAFVQGLVGNIHQAHANGFRDSAEHLRAIINKLEDGFATVANVGEGTM